MNKFEVMKKQLKEGGVKVVAAPGLFPTPRAVVAAILHRAQLQPWHTVLEPSAGAGAIMDAAKFLTQDVTGIEINHGLCQALAAKSHNIIQRDFLAPPEYPGDMAYLYDRILMNPPFERGQDIDHVQHAFHKLKPGGRLVAVMCSGPFFRQDKKSTAFREWIEETGALVEDLPDNSFKDSGTGVSTKIVIIDKPEVLEPL